MVEIVLMSDKKIFSSQTIVKTWEGILHFGNGLQKMQRMLFCLNRRLLQFAPEKQ